MFLLPIPRNLLLAISESILLPGCRLNSILNGRLATATFSIGFRELASEYDVSDESSYMTSLPSCRSLTYSSVGPDTALDRHNLLCNAALLILL